MAINDLCVICGFWKTLTKNLKNIRNLYRKTKKFKCVFKKKNKILNKLLLKPN